eukprot:792802-Pyramimonas_sp.AAC.1
MFFAWPGQGRLLLPAQDNRLGCILDVGRGFNDAQLLRQTRSGRLSRRRAASSSPAAKLEET